MNYRGKKVAITGADGFIGGQLHRALVGDNQAQLSASEILTKPFNSNGRANIPAEVVVLSGDIRECCTFAQLDHTFDYLFHFAAPSSQILFNRAPRLAIDTTISGFMNAAAACTDKGIRLVYPSTGLLSTGETNAYARCKAICEDYAAGQDLDAIGLRIFATYGPGEGHKRDYASVPYLFARDMVAAKDPVIFGNGEQVRDFIYIEDVVQAILHLAEDCPDTVVDVGVGNGQSFNAVVKQINAALDDTIEAGYAIPPAGYVKKTVADPRRLWDFYQPQVSFSEGIEHLVKHLKELQS